MGTGYRAGLELPMENLLVANCSVFARDRMTFDPAEVSIMESWAFWSRLTPKAPQVDTQRSICETQKCRWPGEIRPASLLCRSGGIGRRAWFRSMYSQGCGGSSPFFGTSLFRAKRDKRKASSFLSVNSAK